LDPSVKRFHLINDGTPPPRFGILTMSHVQSQTDGARIDVQVLVFEPTGVEEGAKEMDMP
jgi:hypothetical protein